MRNLIVTGVLLITILSACTKDKHAEAPFASELKFRHPLYKGGFETIKFKPNGQVYAEMLVNGEEVKANGSYKIKDKRRIEVALSTGPYQKIHFFKIADEIMVESSRTFEWMKY
jgi:hypothetical protein